MTQSSDHIIEEGLPLFRSAWGTCSKRSASAAIFTGPLPAPPLVRGSSERSCTSLRRSSPAQITSSVVNAICPAPSAARVRWRELRRRPGTATAMSMTARPPDPSRNTSCGCIDYLMSAHYDAPLARSRAPRRVSLELASHSPCHRFFRYLSGRNRLTAGILRHDERRQPPGLGMRSPSRLSASSHSS